MTKLEIVKTGLYEKNASLVVMFENGKIKGDTAIALISTGALAIGVMVTSMTSGMNIDIYNYMFGSILTMSKGDVVISSVLSICVIGLFVIFYREIFAVTFDETFASATGTSTKAINTLIAVVTAVVIVLAMNLVGALLISALIIFPALSAMRIFKSFFSVIISSAVISVVCAVIGILIAILYGTPVGSTIVAADIAAFIICSVIGKISK